MIDFNKISIENQQELMATIQKNVEKSELDRFYLFTINPLEKAKLYIWCCRFLIGITNILEDSDLKTVLMEEVNNQKELYFIISGLLYKVDSSFINKNRNTDKLKALVTEDNRVDEMIDAFAILLEKQNILSMSRIKGILLDGNSGKEFKKIFNQNISETQNFVEEAEQINEETETQEETQQTIQAEKEILDIIPKDASEQFENKDEDKDEDLDILDTLRAEDTPEQEEESPFTQEELMN
jgi:hypothetical protein